MSGSDHSFKNKIMNCFIYMFFVKRLLINEWS